MYNTKCDMDYSEHGKTISERMFFFIFPYKKNFDNKKR